MAKSIKLSNEEINRLVDDFRTNLQNSRCLSHEVRYTFKTEKKDAKVKLVFTEEAYIKTKALVADFDTEVQWHGLVDRVDDTTFLIKDIFVAPHEVTGVTVTSDNEEYNLFMEDLERSGQKVEMRFHGHSHVNMHVTPSATDITYRRNIVDNFSPLFDNYFYIFIILNKKGDFSGQVYDLENNILYETEDIEFDKQLGSYNLDLFLEDAHRLATKPEPKLPFQGSENKKNEKEEKETKDKTSQVKYPAVKPGYHIDGYDDDDSKFNYYDALYNG